MKKKQTLTTKSAHNTIVSYFSDSQGNFLLYNAIKFCLKNYSQAMVTDLVQALLPHCAGAHSIKLHQLVTSSSLRTYVCYKELGLSRAFSVPMSALCIGG